MADPRDDFSENNEETIEKPELDENPETHTEVNLEPNEGVDPEDLKVDNQPKEEEEVRDEVEEKPAEHTLDDLADEESPTEELPTGVSPSRPKSFSMMDDENDTVSSAVPSSGMYDRSSFLGGDRQMGRKSGGKFKSIILLLIVIAVLGGAVYLLKGKFINSSGGSAPSSSPSVEVPSSTPTPTPSPSVDRSKYKIRILNGTSTSGLAASVSAKLKGLGYQIDKTGNASNSAFTSTVVRVKDGTDGLLDTLVKDLMPDYSANSGGSLPSSDSADGEVTIGTK